MHILDAVRLQLYVETLFCIAPYWPSGRRVRRNAWATVWTVGGAGAFVGLVIAASLRDRADRAPELRFSHGYLWAVIATFEFSFTNIAFPLVVLNTLLYRRHHIDFYNGIAVLDEQLTDELGISLAEVNRRRRFQLLWFMAATLPYFNLMWAGLVAVLSVSGVTLGTGLLLFIFANQMEQFTMGLLTWSICGRMLLVRDRFCEMRGVRLDALTMAAGGAHGLRRARERVAVWLGAFQRLVGLIDGLSGSVGNVMAVRFMHDFTLLLSQLYLAVYLLVEYRSDNWVPIVFVGFWAMQNATKIVCTAFAAHVTVVEVGDFLFVCVCL